MNDLERRPLVLVFAPSPQGGLAEHTFYQVTALASENCVVSCLICPSFLSDRTPPFACEPVLAEPHSRGISRWRRRLGYLRRMFYNQLRLVWEILRRRPSLVLLESYTEYLSPIWIWPHWILARLFGITYAANLHDPVRDYQVGPAWWHRWSVQLAYLPLDFVLIHHPLPHPSPVPARVKTVEVPVGVYSLPAARISAEELRQQWGIPESSLVFLSFGYIRDNKNLDLVLRAASQVPEAYVVVAGSIQSAKDKPFAFYQQLAAELGIADRCRFMEGFVGDADLADYFEAADFALLTYSASFHSQSGVLNLAVAARKPVLASAARGPLVACVENFHLGVVVAPDSADAIAAGMRGLLAGCEPQWDKYAREHGWARNARGILDAAGLSSGPQIYREKSDDDPGRLKRAL